MIDKTNNVRDEISIYYLIDLLIKNIILIIIISIIASTISYIFLFNKNTVYLGTVGINMVSVEKASKFAKLNYLSKEYIENYKDGVGYYSEIINREALRDRFEDEFEIGMISKQVIEKLPIDEQQYISHRSFQIDKKLNTLSFNVIERDLAKPVIDEIQKQINKKIFRDLLNILENDYDAYRDNIEFQISAAEKKIEQEKKKLIRDTETRVAFLEEQAAIAKALKIDGASMQIRQALRINEERSVTESFFIQNYYLIGYVAIEKEIELLKNRNQNLLDLYNPEYNKGINKIELLKLKMDGFKNYYFDIYESISQLSEFSAAEINLDSIVISNNNRERYMLSLFFVFLTLVVTIISILLYDGFIKYQNK